MGRPIPSSLASTSYALSLPLLAASIAATAAVFVTLCMTHHRRSSSPKSQPPTPKKQQPSSPSTTISSATSDKSVKKTDTTSAEAAANKMMSPPERDQDHDQERTKYRPPPMVFDVAATHGPIGPVSTPDVSTSQQRSRLSASLSMRLTERVSKIRTHRKEKEKQQPQQEEEEVEKVAATAEESVWMKTIILGGRCKVPNSDDEQEAARYDEKGNKQRNYHPRTPRSLPVSRTNSFTAVDTAA